MANRKVIFLIVEGPSEEDALGFAFQRIFSSEHVHIHVVHGDITSMDGVTQENVVKKIVDRVKAEINKNVGFLKKDLREIIHIVDTDGVFIPDEYVVCDASAEKPIYSENEIRTSKKEYIEKRNRRKSANLVKLHRTNEMWEIPYRVYYMSCNLDHVLCNRLNCSDEEKEDNAFCFAQQYKTNMKGFYEFIARSPFSVMDDYRDSWAYIKQELHSLERHTNLGLCFPAEEDSDTDDCEAGTTKTT